MYSDRFSLPFVSQLLIAAAERVRPGLGAWSAEVRAKLEQVFRRELAEVKARFTELFDDTEYWNKLESNAMEVCFPRYAAVAERATALERSDYGVWRGGDLVARGVYMVVGLALGVFLVKAPFIPIPETWDFLILGFLLASPFVPDAQVWLAQKRHGAELAAIVEDMRAAHEQQRLYEPLRALQDTLRFDSAGEPLRATASAQPEPDPKPTSLTAPQPVPRERTH